MSYMGSPAVEDSLWIVRMLNDESGGADERDLIESQKHAKFG